MGSKACGRCNLIKLVNDFNKKSSASDGYMNICKVCCLEYNKQWVNDNREYVRERERNRRVNNPHHRISINMHRRLNHTLHRGIYSARTEEILDIPKGLYLEWLSFNFENGMCFANYGKLWQIDLIIPASSFELTNEQQLLAAFNWRNIRPCLKSENAAKYNFILPFAQANQSIRILAFTRKMKQLAIVNNQILI